MMPNIATTTAAITMPTTTIGEDDDFRSTGAEDTAGDKAGLAPPDTQRGNLVELPLTYPEGKFRK